MMKKFAQRSRAAFSAIVVGGLIGLLAAAAALGVAELVAGFTGIAGEPVIAVGGAAIDLTPIPVKDFAILHFGSHDKTVLLTGIYVVLALFAMVTGILARRRIGYGLAGLGVFAVLGVAAVLTRPVSSPVDAVPTVVGVIVGALVMALLVRAARAPAGQRGENVVSATEPVVVPSGPAPAAGGAPSGGPGSGADALAQRVVPAAGSWRCPRPPEIPAHRRRGRRPRGGRSRGRAGLAVPVQRVRGAFRHHPSRPGGHRAAAAGRRAARRPGDQPVHHARRELLPGGHRAQPAPGPAGDSGTCGCTAWSSGSWTSPSTSC